MVVAHTLPELTASIRVLEKNVFVLRGTPAEEGAIRFELDLLAYSPDAYQRWRGAAEASCSKRLACS